MQTTSLTISALVRNEEKAAKLERLGVKAVVGSLEDTALLEAEGAKADAIIQIVGWLQSVTCATLTM